MIYTPYPHINIEGNVLLEVRRKGQVVFRQVCQNLVMTEGLQALCYNIANGDGSVVEFIEYSTSSTAPALADTTVPSILLTTKNVGGFTHRSGVACWHFRLPLDPNDVLGVNGETIRRLGLRTGDTGGAKASDDALVASVLLDYPVAKDAETELHGLWMIRFTLQDTDTVQWYPLAPWYFASRLVDLSEADVLDQLAFGTGAAPTLTPELDTLGTEVYREDPGWSESGATVTCSGTVTSGEHAGTLSEAGPSWSATAAVLARLSGFSETTDMPYTVTITFGNMDRERATMSGDVRTTMTDDERIIMNTKGAG